MKFVLFASILIVIVCYALWIGGYIYFPTDILFYISDSSKDWQKVHNSLLADPVFQFEPWRHYAKERIMAGSIPFWNPSNGAGAPFLANPQAAIFYPLNLIYYITPISISLNLIPLIKIIFMAAFSFMYFRSLRTGKALSALGAIIATFTGFPIMWLLWPHTNVYILFPLLLYLTEMLLANKKAVKFILILHSLVYLVGVLGGHPETLFHIGVIHFIYSFYRLRLTSIFIKQLVFIGLGFLLSSFMLFPFFEYLLNSYLMSTRLSGGDYFLPIKSAIYNLFPLVLGAPHLEIYRSFSKLTNFQELAGGFTGIFVIIVSLAGFALFRKNKLIRFFGIFSLVLVGIVYKVWPFYLIVSLPLINSVANYRLIGVAGFMSVAMFVLTLSEIKKRRSINFTKKMLINVSAILLVCLILVFIGLLILLEVRFQLFYLSWVSALFLSIFFGILSLYFFSTKKNIASFILIILSTVAPLLLLFYNYVSFLKTSTYYKESTLVKRLKLLPKGRVLQVGNLYFPPNINLIYGLENAQNDDAIGTFSYQRKFNSTFRSINYKKIVDQVDSTLLQEFGIKYLVIDYNPNYKLLTINSESNKVLSLNKKVVKIGFMAIRNIRQIRFITANFNRKNDCKLKVSIFSENKLSDSSILFCQDIHDGEFVTIDISKDLIEGKKYEVVFEGIDTSSTNFIGLRGGNRPYLDLLHGPSEGKFQLVDRKSNLWYVLPKKEENSKNYKIITDKPENFAVVVTVKKPEDITLTKTNYPGWELYIDGKLRKSSDNTFFKFILSKGEHLVELKYSPRIFYVGLVISIATFLGLTIFILRGSFGVIRKWYSFARLNFPNSKEFILLYILSLLVSSIVFLVIVQNMTFETIKTNSYGINWYILNNYPKSRDQLLFAIGLLLAVIMPILIIGYRVWKHSKNKS